MLITSASHSPAATAYIGRPDVTRETDVPRAPDKEIDKGSSRTSLEGRQQAATPTYSDPRVEAQRKARETAEHKQQLLESAKIQELAARDREVRAHEQAHVALGGRYAGAAVYQYERGPNGVSYAVGGEVSISTGPASTPEETLLKAQTIRRAALAPAEPSPQDRQVAAQASRLEAQARQELAERNEPDARTTQAAAAENRAASLVDSDDAESPLTTDQSSSANTNTADRHNTLSPRSTSGHSQNDPFRSQFLTGYQVTQTIGGVIDSRA